MSEITEPNTERKRGRGRPRKYATPEARRAAIAERKAAQAADRAAQRAIAKADAKAAAQIPVHWLLITVKQTAEALQISERTVFNLIDEGRLDSVKIGGARRISLDAVKELASTGA